jgi:RecA-family ATPase
VPPGDHRFPHGTPSQTNSRKTDLDYVDDMIDYIPLRGELVDLDRLADELKYVKPHDYGLIILDAFYKFMPPRTDENDNGQMTHLYNKLDFYANITKSAICLIHHATKGLQSGKKVTDVGAGACVQSRAGEGWRQRTPVQNAHGFIDPYAYPTAAWEIVIEALD